MRLRETGRVLARPIVPPSQGGDTGSNPVGTAHPVSRQEIPRFWLRPGTLGWTAVQQTHAARRKDAFRGTNFRVISVDDLARSIDRFRCSRCDSRQRC